MPDGFQIDFLTIVKTVDARFNSALDHRIIVIQFHDETINEFFATAEMMVISGSNHTRDGLVLQLKGSPQSLSNLLTSLRNRIPLRSISTNLTQPAMANLGLGETDRRVLLTAFKHGYYENPKRTSVRELASVLEMSKSSVANHLRAAENRLIQNWLRDR